MLKELLSPIYNDAFVYSFSLNARFKIMCFTFSKTTRISMQRNKMKEQLVSCTNCKYFKVICKKNIKMYSGFIRPMCKPDIGDGSNDSTHRADQTVDMGIV